MVNNIMAFSTEENTIFYLIYKMNIILDWYNMMCFQVFISFTFLAYFISFLYFFNPCFSLLRPIPHSPIMNFFFSWYIYVCGVTFSGTSFCCIYSIFFNIKCFITYYTKFFYKILFSLYSTFSLASYGTKKSSFVFSIKPTFSNFKRFITNNTYFINPFIIMFHNNIIIKGGTYVQ